MSLSIFVDKTKLPEVAEVTQVLGASLPSWTGLLDTFIQDYPPASLQWRYYGQNSGWSLALKQKNRTLAYLYPCEGRFISLFVYGENAAQAACQSDLPEDVVASIHTARAYAEGRSFQFEVANEADLGVLKRLIAIKAEY